MVDPNFIAAEPDFSELETKYSLPSGLLGSVMKAESNGNVNAISNKGAKGPFQFMPKTAKAFGVNDPHDINQAAEGAAKYYRHLLDMHDNDLPKAIASYNWGPGNVKKHGVSKAPPDTQEYLNKVLSGMPNEDFIPAKAKEAEPDFIPAEASPVGQFGDTIGAIGKHVGSSLIKAAKDVTDTALATGDILAPVGTALGGIASMGQPFGEAENTVQWWANELNPTNLAKKLGYTPSDSGAGAEQTKWAEVPMGAIANAANRAGEYVAEHGIHAGPAMIPPSPELGAAINVATQTLPFAVAHKAGKTIEAAGEKLIPKPVGERPAFDFLPSEVKPISEAKPSVESKLDYKDSTNQRLEEITRRYKEDMAEYVDYPEKAASIRKTAETELRRLAVEEVASKEEGKKFEMKDVRNFLDDLTDSDIKPRPSTEQAFNSAKENWTKAETLKDNTPEGNYHRNNLLSPEAWDHFKNGDINSALKDYADKTTNEPLRLIANRLNEFDWAGTKTVIEAAIPDPYGRKFGPGEMISGLWNSTTGTITLNPNARNSAKTLLHELLHATTARAIEKPKSINEISLRHELKYIMDQYDKHTGKVGEEGTAFQGIRNSTDRLIEFAAEVFARGKVYNELAKIADPRSKFDKAISGVKTLYTRFIQALSKFLNVDSLGHRAASVIDQIMEATAEGLPLGRTGKPLIIEDVIRSANKSRPSIQRDITPIIDRRTAEEFKKQEYNKLKDEEGVIPKNHDISERGTDFLSARGVQLHNINLKTYKPETYGQKLVHWVVDNTYIITRKWDKIASELLHGKLVSGYGITTLRKFKRGDAGILKPYFDLKGKDLQAVQNVWSKFERDNKELIDRGLQWPDERMLTREGLSPEQQKGYNSLASLFDTLFDITNYALKMKGEAPIEKIPGFYPHYMRGRYRIHIMDYVSKHQEIVPFKSKREAEAFIKDNFKDPNKARSDGLYILKDPGTRDFVRGGGASTMPNWAAEVAIAAERHMSKGKLNPILRKRLDQMIANSSSAFLKSAMERTGAVTKYIGAEGVHGAIDSQAVMNVINHYTQSVFKFAKNTDIQKNIYEPALEMSRGLENTTTYVDHFLRNAMDKNLNSAKPIDNFIDSWGNKPLGLEPGAIQQMVPISNRLLMIKALAMSPAFATVQAIQPIQAGTAFLPMYSAFMKAQGYKVPNAMGAIIKAEKELHLFLSREGEAALKYAVENHITDTAIWEMLQRQLGGAPNIHSKALTQIIKDKIKNNVDRLTFRPGLEWLETIGRAKVFLQGYFYAREAGFDKQRALDFADKYTTDIIMGNYSKSFRPLMMENYGSVGKSYSPFMNLMNTYIGNMAYLGRNVKNSPNKKEALAAAGAFLLSTWVFSGLLGQPGVQEWDAIVDMWKKYFPENAPKTSKEAMLDNNIPEILAYGPVTSATKLIPGLEHGINIGEKMGSPTVTGRGELPSIGMMGGLGEASWIGLKSIWPGATVTSGEQLSAMQAISPPPIRAMVEQSFTRSNGMIPVPGKTMQGLYVREASDWAARYLGSRSINESTEMSRKFSQQSFDMTNKEAVKKITGKVADLMDKGNMEGIGKLLREANIYGGDVDYIIEAAKEQLIGREIGWKEREIMGAGEGISAARKLENLRKLYQQ